MTATNTRVVLGTRPSGLPRISDFRFETAEPGHPEPGEALVRTIYVSLDPFVRGRLGAGMAFGSTAPSLAIGDVIMGASVGVVVETESPDLSVGDIVLGSAGWQQFAVQSAGSLRVIQAGQAPISTLLGVLGMPGFTGWLSMRRITPPIAGQSVVISAASGAVGSLAGQLARLDGARVVGIAGGPEKTAWLDTIGFDAVVDHRSLSFASDLAETTPDGIDVYLENVGGEVFETVVPLLNPNARVALCGLVANYNGERGAGELDVPALMSALLTRQVTVQGFSFPPWVEEHDSEFRREVSEGIASGQIRYREDIRQGIEQAPAAFIGLFSGDNSGKLLVQVSADPTTESR